MRIYRTATVFLVPAIAHLLRLIFLATAAALYVYFLPSLIAEKRKLPRTQALFVWNLAAGWLIIPWVIALVLAYKMDPMPQTTA